MASPFAVFRKYQKPMMAVLGILCMIAFSVVGFSGWGRNGEAGGDPLVATTRFGKLYRSQVEMLTQMRFRANYIVARAAHADVLVQALRQLPGREAAARDAEERFYHYFGRPDEESVVETFVQAELAREMGITVGDAAVNHFLQGELADLRTMVIRQLFNQEAEPPDYREVFSSVGISEAQAFAALEHELLARKFRDMFFPRTSTDPLLRQLGLEVAGGVAATPAQRWEYFLRENPRATAEVAGIPVADFLEKVAEPHDSQVKQFYEQYRLKEPDPLSPEPGFKIPKRVRVQYAVAAYEKFLRPQEVSLQEIADRYDRDKDDLYVHPKLLSYEAEKREQHRRLKEEQEKKDKQKQTKKQKQGKPAGAGKGLMKSKLSGEKAGGQPERNKAGKNKPKRAVEGQGARRQIGVHSLVGAAPMGWVALAAVQAPADEVGARSDRSDQSDPTDTSNQSDRTDSFSSDQPVRTDRPDQADQPDQPHPPAPPPAIDVEKFMLPPADIRERVYRPLSEVAEEIRSRIAAERAEERMQAAIDEVRSAAAAYSRELARYALDVKQDPQLPPPSRPDFAALARRKGLMFRTTKLISAVLARSLPGLGESAVSGLGVQQTFVDLAFADPPLYQPETTQDVSRNRYVFWLVAAEPARVPELNEIRAEVVRAWKLVQARALARQHAARLADEARTAKKTLAEFLKGWKHQVVQTDRFSWMTFGSAGGFAFAMTPVLSQVKGVDSPGHEFMRTVFGLEVGQFGVAMNQPQTVAYIIRLTSLEPSREVQRAEFISERLPFYMRTATGDQQELIDTWRKGIARAAGLVWAPGHPAARTGRSTAEGDEQN